MGGDSAESADGGSASKRGTTASGAHQLRSLTGQMTSEHRYGEVQVDRSLGKGVLSIIAKDPSLPALAGGGAPIFLVTHNAGRHHAVSHRLTRHRPTMPCPPGVCDLAPHLETFTAAQGLHDRVMTGHDEDESMFRPF